MLSLTIQAENLDDLHTKLRDLVFQTTPAASTAALTGGDEAGEESPKQEIIPPAANSRPGRKRAAPTPEAEKPKAPEAEKPKDEAPKVPTYDDMVNALKKVNMAEGGGLPAVRALLGEFSAQATRDVKPGQYEAVIKAAQDWKPAA